MRAFFIYLNDAVPIGFAHGIMLRNQVEAGQVIKWSDVVFDESNDAIRVRREMEAMFARELGIELPAATKQHGSSRVSDSSLSPGNKARL